MANCGKCGQDYLRCNCVSAQPFCEQCGEDSKCNAIMDSQCVIYHPDNDKPSQLGNLGMSNGSSAEAIFEAINDLLGDGTNVPLTGVNTPSILLQTTGTAKHTLQADLVLSTDVNNQAEVRPNGLFVKPYNENYLVKLNPTTAPNYLENLIVGDTDGCVSVTTSVVNGQIRVKPSLDVLCLLQKIREDFPEQFCALFADVCQRLGWLPDELECLIEEVELDSVNTGSGLPEPSYSFVDNGTVYFVSLSNNTGKVWSINPYTYVSNASIVYLNETRSGQPYGASGGTYVSGAPYKGNAGSPVVGPANIPGTYYDAETRTLFTHGNKTYGCDYYDFNTATWGKVSVGSTGSIYNITPNTDPYTHVRMSSHKDTDYILTGWGVDSADGGRRIILINKQTRTIDVEKNTGSSLIVGTSSQPFVGQWQAQLSKDDLIIVGKGATSYRNVAILNTDFSLNQQLVLPISNTNYSGQGSVYWQTLFVDTEKDTIYVNDYMGRAVMVYQKPSGATSYSLSATWNLENNRAFPTATCVFAINPITSELYMDIFYGDTNPTYTPNGTADALPGQMISYKINRDTLAIEKVYIGQLKASNLTLLPNDDVLTSTLGTHNDGTPASNGTFSLFQQSTDSLNTGIVRVKTLKQVNVNNNNAPTGVVKNNVQGDPDYLADYQDLTLCPIEYTLACPSSVVMTVKNLGGYRVYAEFGLGAEVVNNPALIAIRGTFRVGSTVVATSEWNVPNTTSPNAFRVDAALTGVVATNSVALSLEYIGNGNVVLATCANVATYVAP